MPSMYQALGPVSNVTNEYIHTQQTLAGKMAQQGKTLGAKPNDLSPIPGTYIVEEPSPSSLSDA